MDCMAYLLRRKVDQKNFQLGIYPIYKFQQLRSHNSSESKGRFCRASYSMSVGARPFLVISHLPCKSLFASMHDGGRVFVGFSLHYFAAGYRQKFLRNSIRSHLD